MLRTSYANVAYIYRIEADPPALLLHTGGKQAVGSSPHDESLLPGALAFPMALANPWVERPHPVRQK